MKMKDLFALQQSTHELTACDNLVTCPQMMHIYSDRIHYVTSEEWF